jgi:trehalose 6-phosphate synthase/phosphatase
MAARSPAQPPVDVPEGRRRSDAAPDPRSIAMADRLVVVSNRLPLTARRVAGQWQAQHSAGGLVAAVEPVIQRTGGMWVGWPGDSPVADPTGWAEFLAGWERDRGFVSVELPAQVSRAFYEGYSNGTLWPLLHGFPTRVVIDPGTWRAYRDANQRFADAILARHRPGDLVWVHDYQLMLLPRLLRDAVPDIRVGFFLHIPFVATEIFRIVPQREELLEGLLGADLLGFQTHEHLGAFRRALLRVLGVDSRMDRTEADGRPVYLEALPIGIAAGAWEQLAGQDPAVARRVRDLRTRHQGRQLILAVDRLDYTKGIPERLRALRALFLSHPGWRGKVTMIQVAVPSREQVRRYVELRQQVSELVGELNGEFGTPDWTPVIYLRRSVTRAELAALYRVADVAWVAPLRDGMNIVAKEYVACQGDGAGVLVLSEFAGAAREMAEAIRVNPYDPDGSAEAIDRALTLPFEDRRERQAALLERVRRNSAFAWSDRFLRRLREAVGERGSMGAALPEPPVAEVQAAFHRAADRTLFLDYDGTLVPIAARPADAVPSDAVREILVALSRCERTTTVIVSGRSQADLDRWFGDLPGLWLAAEHGAVMRAPGGVEWRPLRPGADLEWKDRIRPILEHFTARAPGSLIEEKGHALAWHYRLTEPEFGAWIANELGMTLDEQLSGTELAVLHGNKVIEIRYAWANKGEVAAHILATTASPDFLLAMGDDRTDEDLFERLAAETWTIRVGPGSTRATYRVGGPPGALGLLAALAAPVPATSPAKR